MLKRFSHNLAGFRRGFIFSENIKTSLFCKIINKKIKLVLNVSKYIMSIGARFGVI